LLDGPFTEDFPMSFLCCLMLTLAWSDEPAPGPAPEPTAVEKCLTKPISCCFKDVSLQEACEWFEYAMCVKITIDDDAMRQARSDEGRHASLEVENMPFEEVLEKLLKPMGLEFVVMENGIRIMTGAVETGPMPSPATDEEVPYSEEEPAKQEFVQWEPHMSTVVHPVADLMHNAFAELVMPYHHVYMMRAFKGGLLVYQITTEISPDSWDIVGGKGRIDFDAPAMTLVVVNTQEVQEQVADFLAKTRKEMGISPTAEDEKLSTKTKLGENVVIGQFTQQELQEHAIQHTAGPTAPGQIHWLLEYNVARRKAEAKDRPLLVHFFAEHSTYCRTMFEKAFHDPKLVRTINKHFVALKMDGDKDGKLADMLGIGNYPTMLGIGNYPTTVVAAPDGKILDTLVGYMDAPEFLEKLHGVMKSVARAEENRFLDSTTGGDEESEPSDNQATIERKLARPISVNFQKAPLETVCRDLQNLTGINIVLDKKALEAANVGLDQPLSLNVEHISTKCVLNLLLKELNLTYQIKDNALVVTTEAAVRGPLKNVTYSVARYLERTDADKHCEKKLIDLITNSIAPESWECAGGQGTIHYCRDQQTLVIGQQTQDVHEQVTELLAALDRLRENPGILQPCTIEQLNEEPKSKISIINTPFPPSLRGLVSDLRTTPPFVQVVFPVADLVVPVDEVTPVVCQMLDKSYQPNAKDGRTIERDLIKLITTKIDPDSWECNGGCGKIQYFPLGMQLVVVNTKDVQKKVVDLLNNLRQLQDQQCKEYCLEMKLVQAQEDGEPKEFPLPRVTMMQGRWFTMFQGKTVTLKEGTIQDLLAETAEKTLAVRVADKNVLPTKEDDVLVGVVIRAKVATLAAKLVRLDLVIQKNELDSASRDDIVVVGNSVRSAQRIPTGEAFNHVLDEDADGNPLLWLEMRVTTPQGEVKPPVSQEEERIFRGIGEPIPRP
jgi:thioredoxin-related protein